MPITYDYYRLLQVEPEADEITLKKAYRRLAVIWHPDRNPGSSVAEERFKAIAEAYAVLSDPKKRKRYDNLGPEAFSEEFSTADIFQGFDLSDLFQEFGLAPIKETLFKTLELEPSGAESTRPYQDFFAKFGQKSEPKKKRSAPSSALEIVLAVSLKEAVFGAIKTVAFNQSTEVIKVAITVPPGAKEGQKIKVPRRGPGSENLTVCLNVRPEPNFRILGQDLMTTVLISKSELKRGCRPIITTLDGQSLKLTVPPATAPGARLKAAGHGVPGLDGRRGNLIVTILEKRVAGAG
ncbi:MAG: DnaJ domain-containing protein [Deltaproteobacteria bacterium]|nr:DnaJ domain-containing protein [Deltaproteobacteria bacterium]